MPELSVTENNYTWCATSQKTLKLHTRRHENLKSHNYKQD
jgi:hypothetical protein